jgi:hypothetical protein
MKPLSYCVRSALIVGASLAAAHLPASPSLSVGLAVGTPGTTVQVAVHYTTDTNAAALQFDLIYDPAYLTSGEPVRGDALSEHLVASSEPSPGVRRVLIFSMSNTPITNGVLAYVPFTIRTNTPDHDEPMTLSNVVVANLEADVIPAYTTNGVLAVATQPRFTSIRPAAGSAMHLELVGPPGRRFLIQGSRSLAQPIWAPLYSNVASSGVLKFDDLSAASLS